MARTKKLKSTLHGRRCCFCGSQATTVDHVPPIVFFRDKQRPKGHEYPACERCNKGSALQDTVVALFCHVASDFATPSHFSPKQIDALQSAIANNCPEVLSYFGPDSEDFLMFLGGGYVKLKRVSINPALFRDWLNPWAAKVGCALWYETTKQYIPATARIIVRWITNDSMIRNGPPEMLIEMHKRLTVMRQGSKRFDDQFAYRYEINVVELLGSFVVLLQNSVVALVQVLPATGLGKIHPHLGAGEVFYVSESTGISPTVYAPIAWG